MNDAKAKNVLRSLQSKQKTIFVLAGVLLLAFLLLLTVDVMRRANSGLSSTRAPRTAAGAGWTYTVDPVLETKFTILVIQEANTVRIGGKGCNLLSASVVEDDNGVDNATHRSIRGKVYRLSEGTSTMMACSGEAAHYDSQLMAEINRIFFSLE